MLTPPRTGAIAGLGGPIAVPGEPGGGEVFKSAPPEAGRAGPRCKGG